MKKKGAADAAAVLVFIFAVLLILYILLIPASNREEILNIDGVNGGTSNSTLSKDKDIILEEEPGAITKEGRSEYEYDVPSISLSSTTGAEVIKEENPFIIKNGWFVKKTKTIEFEVENKETISNLILSFNTIKREGTLIIKLNDVVIYEKAIDKYNADPVIIPKTNLKTGLNTLELSTSSVGLAFWTANKYSFENIKLLGDVTDISGLKTEEVFFIPNSRINIESGNLKFVPECETSKIGKLNIDLNGRRLLSAIPDCKVLNSIIVPPNYFEDGVNSLRFETEKGTYLVDGIYIKTELKDRVLPTYFFNIDDDQWKDIDSVNFFANLTVDFLVPEDKYINMKITINNRDFGVYQRDSEFTKNIDDYLQDGNNVIRLVPETDVDVIKLKIGVQEIE